MIIMIMLQLIIKMMLELQLDYWILGQGGADARQGALSRHQRVIVRRTRARKLILRSCVCRCQRKKGSLYYRKTWLGWVGLD